MKRSLLNAVLILAIAAFAVLSFAAEKPATDPAPGLQYLTPEQTAVLRDALNLPPGTLVEVEFQSRDGGTLKVTQEATGKGAGAMAEGDKLSENFTGSPPEARLDDTGDAKGGDAKAKQSASAIQIPPLPWANPLFWLGVACLGGAGFCIYARLRRGAVICGVGGVGFLAAAFYPALLLWCVAVVAVVYLLGHLKAEQEASEREGLLAKVTRGIDSKVLPANVKAQVKEAIGSDMTKADALKLEKLLQKHGIGKYAAK